MSEGILVVCTGNIFRSPMACALLRHRFAAAGLATTVESAGTLDTDRPAVAGAVAAMDRRGIDLGGHHSRPLAGELIAAADLVLGMERLHVREVVVVDPDAWPRTFTLKELVRRAEQADRRGADESLDAWVARMHAGRRFDDLLGSSPADDVADLVQGSPDDHEHTAAELEDLVDRLVRALAPRAD